MINLTIDGRQVSVPKGTTVYTAAASIGVDIPVFCYQERMPPFGACRICLVEVEKMHKLQASCTLEVVEGMVVRTQSAKAIEGREAIIEFLLLNHPLDCPICDRGGECPLQEHAYNHGPGESRFFEEKRRFKKPLPLGPVLMLDRERCIVCARCTRFGDLIAGDHALEFIDRGYKTEVGTPNGDPVESKFIGNTIKICPVGALTSQVYRFRARPWDNEPTKSTCPLCPVGCSLILDSRDGEIMRTRSLENRDVNDLWLCDKGWFGYEFTSNVMRLQLPLVRKNGKLENSSWKEALSLIAEKIQEFKEGGKLAGLGGNPLTVEENYLFQKLMREVAGVNNLDHRIGTPIFSLDQEGIASGMEIPMGECEDLSYIIFLGLDLTEEFPVLWLRLRQAINKGAKVLFLGHFAPEISPYFSKIILHPPGKELETIQKNFSAFESFASDEKKGAIFVGRQYLANANRKQILQEVLRFRQSKKNLSLNIMEGRGNSQGARLTGMHPQLGPLGKPLNQSGMNAYQVLEEASKNSWDLLYIAGADPANKYPKNLWEQARKNTKFLVVQDLFLTDTAYQADVVLPVLSFVEKGGSFINIAGRVQHLLPGKEIPENLFSDGEIFIQIAQKCGQPIQVEPSFTQALSSGSIIYTLPEKIEIQESQSVKPYEGKLSLTLAYVLFDQGVRMRHNMHLIQLAKEPKARINLNEAAKRGLKEGDIVCLQANEQSIFMQIKVDRSVADDTIVLPLGFEKKPVYEFSPNLLNGIPMEIKKKE